jgi:hypothetical protein
MRQRRASLAAARSRSFLSAINFRIWAAIASAVFPRLMPFARSFFAILAMLSPL